MVGLTGFLVKEFGLVFAFFLRTGCSPFSLSFVAFGFTALADVAEHAEHYMQGIIDLSVQAMPSDLLGILSEFLSQLQAQMHILIASDNAQDHTQSSPYFEIGQSDTEIFQGQGPLIYICDDEPEQVHYLFKKLHSQSYI